jgi:hypothetical protein
MAAFRSRVGVAENGSTLGRLDNADTIVSFAVSPTGIIPLDEQKTELEALP